MTPLVNRVPIAPIQSSFAVSVVEVAPLAAEVLLPVAFTVRSSRIFVPVYSAPASAIPAADDTLTVIVADALPKTRPIIKPAVDALAPIAVIIEKEIFVPDTPVIGELEAKAMAIMFPAVGVTPRTILIVVA